MQISLTSYANNFTMQNSTLFQANENFTMILSSIDGTVLGRRTSVIITILQNDDANGVFSFLNTSANLNRYAGTLKMPEF